MRYEDIQDWLRQNGLQAAGLARLMHEEASLDDAVDSPELDAVMLDLLRLSGRLPDAAASSGGTD